MKLFKIPLNAGAMDRKKGIEKAPDSIVEHLKDFHLTESGVLPLFEITEIKIDNSHLEEAHNKIYAELAKINTYCALLVSRLLQRTTLAQE